MQTPAAPDTGFHMPTGPRERYGRSLVGSVLAHALIFLFLVVDFSGSPTLPDQQGAGGEGPAGGGGGGGGRVVSYVALPAYQVPRRADAERVTPRPEDILLPTAVLQDVQIVEHFEIPRDASPVDASRILGRGAGEGGGTGAGPGSGGGIGSGQGTGTGSGVGPGTGGGGGEVFLPYPRVAVLPPADAPRGVKGREFLVHFWVSVTGEVLRIEIEPTIRDADYRARFVASLHQWRFNPAVRLDGTPVAWEVIIPVTP